MIDYHSHILPGVDDGAADLEEALAMGRILAGAGFRVVHCTPHCQRGVYSTTPEQVATAVRSLQVEFNRAGIPVELRPGMEYCLDEYFSDVLDNPCLLGDSRLLLVETPSQVHADLVRENLFRGICRGYIPLIAHPERHSWWASAGTTDEGLWTRLRRRFSPAKAPDPATTFPTLEELVAKGCRLQGNLGSLSGYYGPEVRSRARDFLHRQLYTHFGSDAHRRRSLERILGQGLKEVKEQGLGDRG